MPVIRDISLSLKTKEARPLMHACMMLEMKQYYSLEEAFGSKIAKGEGAERALDEIEGQIEIESKKDKET